MYEKFGEFDSFHEINTIAEKLKKEKKIEDLYELASENGIANIDVTLYLGNVTDVLLDVHSAGADKIEIEKNNYLKKKHYNNVNIEEIADFLKVKCYLDAMFAENVRRKGKSFYECIRILEGAYVLLQGKYKNVKITTEILSRVAEDYYMEYEEIQK